jgi:hypothetical protein
MAIRTPSARQVMLSSYSNVCIANVGLRICAMFVSLTSEALSVYLIGESPTADAEFHLRRTGRDH